MIDFTLLNGRVLIEVDEPKTSQGGVDFPDSVQKQPVTGIVRGAALDGDPTMVNRRVLFNRHAGYTVSWNGTAYQMVRLQDIYAILADSVGEVTISD